MNKTVVVVLEIFEERAKEINRGLLAEGSRIANLLGGSLVGITEDPSEWAHRNSSLLPLYTYSSRTWLDTAIDYFERIPFRLVIFPHTDRGMERAALMAQALDTAAVTDCFDIRFRNGTLSFARYVYGSQFEQEVSFSSPPEIVSLSVESLEMRSGSRGIPVPIENISFPIPEDAAVEKIIKIIPPDFRTIDIRYAERILDLGAGCDNPELLEQARELADLLEASVGTTRLVVDNGQISKTRMIGQTGKEISPVFCLALGVSGSPHHTAGIQKSGAILSVNSDERAPILGVSDAGFVTDLKVLLPELISRIRQYRDEGLT